MDDAVLAALKKWPDVPACYGWVRLDARGQWYLGNLGTREQNGQSERVRHQGLAAFLSRNCSANERGEWFVQNGPQRAYITLDATPWIAQYAAANDGHGYEWQTHTGEPITGISSVRIDEQGRIYLSWSGKLAIVDDRDLTRLLDQLHFANGDRTSDTALLALLDAKLDSEAPLADSELRIFLHWQDQRLPVLRCTSDALPHEFGFTRHPTP